MMHAPVRRKKYTSDCVPTAIAAWTGQIVEDVLSNEERHFLFTGCTSPEVHRLIAQSGLPFHYTLWEGRLTDLPLKAKGIAWVKHPPAQGGTRHCVAFDGKLVVDNSVDRVQWVYDHPARKATVFALFLLPS